MAKRANGVENEGLDGFNVTLDNLLPEKQHINFWHTQAAKDHDFRADLDNMGGSFSEPRVGKEL